MAVINLISASKWGVFVVGVYIGVYANQNYKRFYEAKDTNTVIMGLLSLPFAFVGAFASGIVLGVIVDQELKIPRLPHPYDLKDRIIEKMKEYKKDK